MISFVGSISIKGPKASEDDKQQIRDALKKEPDLCNKVRQSDADVTFAVKDGGITVNSNIEELLCLSKGAIRKPNSFIKRVLEMTLAYCNETTETVTEKIYIKGPKSREKEKQQIRDALKRLSPDLVEKINNSDAEVTFYVDGYGDIGIKSNIDIPV